MPDCQSASSRRGRIRVAASGLVLLAVLWPVLGWPVLGGDPARAATGSGSVLILQADGDVVIDAPGGVVLWSTNTSKQTYAVVQPGGARPGTGPVRLPQQHLGPGERLERAGREPGARLRDPAGRSGQQDGRRRVRLAHQPADPDPLG